MAFLKVGIAITALLLGWTAVRAQPRPVVVAPISHQLPASPNGG